MKLQQLSRETSTPVSTVKFYLREGLLPPGRKINATTAVYGSGHVDRLELIRVLRQVVGLGLDRVREVVQAVETLDPVQMMGRVQSIVLDLPAESVSADTTVRPGGSDTASGADDSGTTGESHARTGPPDQGRLTAQDILEAMGWRAGTPESLRALDGQLATMEQWGLAPTLDTVLVYARAVDRVAEHELSSGPAWAAGPEAPAGTRGAGGDRPASGQAEGTVQGPDGTAAGARPSSGAAQGRDGTAEGDRPASGPPSADRIAAYTAVGVHGYSQLLLRLLSVAQGSHARGLGAIP